MKLIAMDDMEGVRAGEEFTTDAKTGAYYVAQGFANDPKDETEKLGSGDLKHGRKGDPTVPQGLGGNGKDDPEAPAEQPRGPGFAAAAGEQAPNEDPDRDETAAEKGTGKSDPEKQDPDQEKTPVDENQNASAENPND